jgi:hypothetical protein
MSLQAFSRATILLVSSHLVMLCLVVPDTSTRLNDTFRRRCVNMEFGSRTLKWAFEISSHFRPWNVSDSRLFLDSKTPVSGYGDISVSELRVSLLPTHVVYWDWRRIDLGMPAMFEWSLQYFLRPSTFDCRLWRLSVTKTFYIRDMNLL